MTGEDLEAAVLGGPLELTREEVSRLTGVPDEQARAVWLAMGFPEVGPGERAFTRRDADALRTAIELCEGGLVDLDTLLVLARAMGQELSRMAEAHVSALRTLAVGLPAEEALAAATASATEVVPQLEQLVVHVWRRQLAAAAGRAFAHLGREGLPVLAVGFVDLVGWTRTSREWEVPALERLLEQFERDTALRVTAQGGRVVKTLGDAVLFVCDDPRAAAEVALGSVQAHAQDERLPEVRAGVASGPVLLRLGDVFGQPVNLASRLSDEARPGTVLVDLEAAAVLSEDPAYELVRVRTRSVRGYSALRPHVLRRAAPAQE